jgi:hypothetical protein
MPTDDDADATGSSGELCFDDALLRDAMVPPTVRDAPWCFPWPDEPRILEAKFSALQRRIAARLAKSQSRASQRTEDT